MVDTINRITPEQEAKIPEYIEKWVRITSQPLNREKTVKVTKELFGEDKTVLIAESVDNAINIIKFIAEGKDLEYSSHLDSQLRSQISSQISSQLDSQLRSQLGFQLDSQLSSQLRSQLGFQLDSQLSSQLRSHLDSQISSQLDSQLRSQLSSHLSSQLRSQLGSHLDSQLRSQLRSQLDSQLRSHLDSQLRSQLRSQLSSQLDSQLSSQLGFQLDSQLSSQLRSQLDFKIPYSYYVTQYWLSWVGYYDYAQFIGVKFDTDKLKRMEEILMAIPSIITLGNILIVIENPVCRWEEGRLSNDQKPAIEWKDSSGIYLLDGVKFEKEVWGKVVSKKMTFGEIMAIEISDQRTVALKYNPEAIIKENAKLVHKDDRNNELYLIEGNKLNEDLGFPKVWFLKMKCPTGRTFVEGVNPEDAEKNPNATAMQALLCGLTLNEYMSMSMES